jgi:hypothetical protein
VDNGFRPVHKSEQRRGQRVEALLDWFRRSTDVGAVHLSATADGIGLYQSFGFSSPEHRYLTLRLE